jgi:hypothetical protein
VRAALIIGMLCVAQLAAASPDAICTVFEISATKDKDASMDADLKPLSKQLAQAPFSAWNVFKLLGKQSAELYQGKPNALTLTVGNASLMLRGRGAAIVNLEVLINNAKGNRVVSAKPDLPVDEWLVFGSGNKDGHLLALRCK